MATIATERPGPGRPSSGARERILAGCLEVLKSDGYAGLTHRQGGGRLGRIEGADRLPLRLEERPRGRGGQRARADDHRRRSSSASRARARSRRSSAGRSPAPGQLLERDERLPRVYFDLNAVSVVEDSVRDVMREVKGGIPHRAHRPAARGRRPGECPRRPRPRGAGHRRDRGPLPGADRTWRHGGSRRARELFVRSMVAACGSPGPAHHSNTRWNGLSRRAQCSAQNSQLRTSLAGIRGSRRQSRSAPTTTST